MAAAIAAATALLKGMLSADGLYFAGIEESGHERAYTDDLVPGGGQQISA